MMIDWIYAHPQLSVAGAALLFWWGRFVFGHKLYWLTCWNRVPVRNKWWHRIDFHDWEPEVGSGAGIRRCTRCLGRYQSRGGYHYTAG